MKNIQLAAILHGIRSVHNVGSIFRTADGAGFEKIYLCGITPTPLDRFKNIRADFAKVSLGAEKNIAWEYEKATATTIKKLKEDGWTIVAVEQSARSIPYHEFTFAKNRKIALVMGNEVKGLSPSILKLSDAIVEIPMHGKKESLNVGVAFGIVAFAIGGKKTMKAYIGVRKR
jgi:23S rRNA (guanosine2251-2'-O)-methyltransferase